MSAQLQVSMTLLYLGLHENFALFYFNKRNAFLKDHYNIQKDLDLLKLLKIPPLSTEVSRVEIQFVIFQVRIWIVVNLEKCCKNQVDCSSLVICETFFAFLDKLARFSIKLDCQISL